jgi:nucleoside-diphosphate-sugar epimerase
MARIVVIGGSGHVGSYLVPTLVERGHEVVNVSRGAAKPYRPHFAWNEIENVSLDRAAEEQSGQFGKKIVQLRPDVVVDMIAFEFRCQFRERFRRNVVRSIGATGQCAR